MLKVPERVQKFVEEWKQQVLASWKLPPAENEEKPRRADKKKAAA